jgi:hypothetical protein
MDWYRIHVSPEQLEFGFADIIRAEMEEIWLARGAPEGFSLWRSSSEDGVDLYLSPVAGACGALLNACFNAVYCEQPPLDELEFLLGHVLYGDHGAQEK